MVRLIEFEKKDERQRKMLKAVMDLVDELLTKYSKEETKISTDILTEIVAMAMGSGILEYSDMFASMKKDALPVKLNTLRLVMVELADKYWNKFGELSKFLSKSGFIPFGASLFTFGTLSSTQRGMDLLINKYLPEALNGNCISFGVTEPDAGTNTHKILTTAIEEGDHYRLNGSKVFISGAETRYMNVLTRIVSNGEFEGIGNLIVDTRTKGISMTPMDIAVLPDDQYIVYLDDVIVPKENLISRPKKEEKDIGGGTFYGLNLERILLSMMVVAVGRMAINKAVEYAKQRKVLSKSIEGYQTIEHSLSKAKIRLELANLATKKAAETFDNKEDLEIIGAYANMAKLTGSEAANEVCNVATQVYGADGLNKDNDISIMYQIARLIRIAPINNEMVLNYIGEHLLGLPKSYR